MNDLPEGIPKSFEIEANAEDDYSDTAFTYVGGPYGWIARSTRTPGLAFYGNSPHVALAGLVNIRSILEGGK